MRPLSPINGVSHATGIKALGLSSPRAAHRSVSDSGRYLVFECFEGLVIHFQSRAAKVKREDSTCHRCLYLKTFE